MRSCFTNLEQVSNEGQPWRTWWKGLSSIVSVVSNKKQEEERES